MKIGFIGLGRMGKNIVLHILENGIEVVAWNRSTEPREQLKQEADQLKAGSENLIIAETIDDLIKRLEPPRIIWLMVSSDAMDAVIADISKKLSKGDIIVDGGNSFYKETIARAKELSEKGIHFMDVGTSGGVEGARNGACMMVGGSIEDFERIEPILRAEAAPSAYGHLGPTGAGHYAKMVHNAIEYGMMEAIGEGAAMIRYSKDFKYDLKEVFRVYSEKSIIDSRLVSWILAELKNDPQLDNITSVIGSAGGAGKKKGEAHWTIEVAKEMGIDTPVIQDSVKVRDNSDKDKENSPNGFRNKVVAAMRWQFGRHPVKKN
jgi:6-phosphogluconate dehydrogenase